MLSPTVPTAPKIIRKTARKSLSVVLTDDELKAKTDQMVSDMHELERLETTFAELKKERATEIKELKACIAKARRVVWAREESQHVDAEQVYDLEAKKTWYEFRGKEYGHTALSQNEISLVTPPPLFPDHEEGAKGELDEDEDDEPTVDPLPPSNVSDIEDVRRSETKRGGKKDHLALG